MTLGRSLKHFDMAKSTLDITFPLSIYSYHLIRDGLLQPYLHKAHWIAHSIHPFINIQRVFYAGVPEAMINDENENDELEQ
jgi:hypothetical protein